MKKLRVLISSAFIALSLICASAMNAFAASESGLGVVNTGDDNTLIYIIAGVAVVALVVIIVSIVLSRKKK